MAMKNWLFCYIVNSVIGVECLPNANAISWWMENVGMSASKSIITEGGKIGRSFVVLTSFEK